MGRAEGVKGRAEGGGVSAQDKRRAQVRNGRRANTWTTTEEAGSQPASGRAGPQAGGQAPSAVDDMAMAELRRHFDDSAVAELVAVIALFGFLNRWNDTLATELEDTPRAFAEEALAPVGWTPGAHEGAR